MKKFKEVAKETAEKVLKYKRKGIDGIVVTIGLCVVALLLCVVMKDGLTTFVTTLITSLTNSATNILGTLG